MYCGFSHRPVSVQEVVDIVPSPNKMSLERVGECLDFSEERDRTDCYAKFM